MMGDAMSTPHRIMCPVCGRRQPGDVDSDLATLHCRCVNRRCRVEFVAEIVGDAITYRHASDRVAC